MDKIPIPSSPAACYDSGMAFRRTVRGSIFLSVALLLVCVLIGFSLIAYDYASAVARDRFAGALSSLSKSVLSNLDSSITEMNRVSLALIYSQVFQNLYARHLALPRAPKTDSERIAKLENAEALIEITETILGPNQVAPQVNVFDLRGQMIGAGFYSQLTDREAERQPWYADVLRGHGERVVVPPHADPFLEQTSVIVKGQRYVSLVRTFQNALLSTSGIIEVEQYAEVLFRELDQLHGSSVSCFLLDGHGNQLYPYDGTVVDASAVARIVHDTKKKPLATGFLPDTRQSEVFAVATSLNTGWTLIIGEPSTGLAASVWQYATRIVLLCLAAMAGSLAASYFIARQLTVPIKSLHAEIEALDIENLADSVGSSRRTRLGEIDELRLAFHDMRLKLNESIREAVSLRAHEKEAQLVALQSQLNPHFLHNMLQTVSIMAEEGETASIQELILNLASVLRYVSSTESPTATLGTEIEYARSYLAAMRARFGESLQYVVDVPAEIREVVVPRLIVQPFLENCFKYATSTRPPWRIEIRGGRETDRWTVEILDSGPGFGCETLERLAGLVRGRRELTDRIAPMSISGMGILNSYERLKIAFGDGALFRLTDRPEGGARVVIGGTI